MKKLILFIIVIITLSCKAQINTVSRYSAPNYGTDNHYYKDIYNDFNNFEGTWLYQNGNNSFKIKLLKKENMHINHTFSNYYTDAVVGEYQYIENGIEEINTLSDLNDSSNNDNYYSIEGGYISKYGDKMCDNNNCAPGDKIVRCIFRDKNCEIYGLTTYIVMKYFVENGVEKLFCKIYGSDMIRTGPEGQEPTCQQYAVPVGEYTLTKQ